MSTVTPRAKLGITAAAVLAAAFAAWQAWSMLADRPAVSGVTAEMRFGVDRAGAPAPAFELATADGSRVSLQDLKGQVVFVNFWATWCPPCRDEMPSMVRLGEELSRKYPGRFKMIAVSEDDGWDPVKEYFAAPPFAGTPAGLTVTLDQGAGLARAYYCTARGFCPDIKFPETYLVDKTGRLVGYVVGPRDWSNPAAREVLEKLLGS